MGVCRVCLRRGWTKGQTNVFPLAALDGDSAAQCDSVGSPHTVLANDEHLVRVPV